MATKPAFSQLLATPETPELGPGPRSGVQPQSALEQKLDGIFRDSKLAREHQQLIRALILLWHDHLEAAHVLAQEIENADGSFVHGIMHRREPDYGNAKYWFRRVGDHRCFPQLARNARALLESRKEQELIERLIPKGQWEAFAFIDLCQAAAQRPASAAVLREVQKIETETLLEHFCSP